MTADVLLPAIFLMGPTASGKTALALALHECFPLDIISVDAAQVYRGLDIGTAKPSLEEQARAPHRLIDIRDPAESYSAAQFCEDARREMDAISARGRIPLLVGGTMFYFRALEYGLSALPAADHDLRAELATEAAALGWPALHTRLHTLDPAAAARIHPNDAQRVQRALEIALRRDDPAAATATLQPSLPYAPIKLALAPQERRTLHERIAVRFHAMLDRGLLSEAEGLYRRADLMLKLPAMRIVGYRQAWDYLSGIINYNTFVDRGIAATRQLAKRQYTWLRSYEGLEWINGDQPDVVSVSAGLIQQKLRGPGIIR
jgi:tRNA dimethylallyltransferase